MPSSHIFQAARLKSGKVAITQVLDLYFIRHKMASWGFFWLAFFLSSLFFTTHILPHASEIAAVLSPSSQGTAKRSCLRARGPLGSYKHNVDSTPEWPFFFSLKAMSLEVTHTSCAASYSHTTLQGGSCYPHYPRSCKEMWKAGMKSQLESVQ